MAKSRKYQNIGLLFATLSFGLGARANIVGSDFQNFNPTYSGLDFVTVHSSETLGECILNTGIFFNQAYNSLPFYESVDFDIDEFRNRSTYSDSIGGFDLNLGYGVSKNWDIGLNVQSIVTQDVKSDSLISGSFEETGLSEIRLNTKYRLAGDETGGLALIGSANFNTIENNIFLGADAGPTFNLEVAFDKLLGNTNWAVNLGYRLRTPGEQLVEGVPVLGNAFIYSTAFSFLFTSLDTKLVWELFGSYPTESNPDVESKSQSNLETLLAFKHDATRQLALVAGLGTEVLAGTATPDWRFFAGLNFALECCEPKDQSNPAPLPKALESYEPYEWSDSEPYMDDRYEEPEYQKGLPPISEPEPVSDEPLFEDTPAEVQESQEVQVQYEPLPPPDEVFVLNDINFQTASYTMVYGTALPYLEKLAAQLKRKGYTKLVVVGHTDSVGSDAYNIKLSKNRASAVANHLINTNGLSRDKVRIKYYGERRPIADNGNYQGRKKNRRVEFEAYY